MGRVSLFTWEMKHYILLALAGTAAGGCIWLCRTGWRESALNTRSEPPLREGRLAIGVVLFVVTVVLLGIFQDMRLGHLCAIHGNCR